MTLLPETPPSRDESEAMVWITKCLGFDMAAALDEGRVLAEAGEGARICLTWVTEIAGRGRRITAEIRMEDVP